MLDDSEIVIDDDLDACNDETFGEDCQEYAWNDPQSMLRSKDPRQVNGTATSKGMGKRGAVVPEGYERYLEDVEDFDDFDDPSFMAVEESISRLVLDDDMDDNFPQPQRRMEATHSSLMPPQVANKRMDWFKNDLGDPLFQSSVWSMHPTESLPTPPKKRQEQLPPVHKLEGPSVLDLNRLVKQQESIPHRPPPGLGKATTSIRYLEDVEQELLAGSSPSPAPSQNNNEAAMHDTKSIISKPSKDFDGRNSVKQEVFPRNENLPDHEIPTGHKFPPGIVHPAQQEYYNQLYQNHQLANLGMRPGYPMNPNVLFNPRFAQGYPPGVIPMLPNIPPNHPSFIAMQQHQMRLHMHQQMNQHQPMFPNKHHMPNSPHMNQAPNTHQQKREQVRHRQTGDPFAGLMTDRDKQRMKNIQMVQLQNDHPFTTDYYYQMKQFQLTRSTTHLAKLFPGDIETSNKNNYEPTRFENALGKLQAVSALAPKRIIDTYIQVHSTTVHGRNHRTRYLLEIEAVYNLFLDVKEIQFRKAAGTWSSIDAMERTDLKAYLALINKLDKYESRLPEWLSIRKGRILVFNLINCFQEIPNVRTVAYRILSNVLRYIKPADMKRLDSKVFAFGIRDLISEATFQDLNMLLESCNPTIWQSRLGSTIFFALLEKSSNKNIRDIAPEFWNGNWTDPQSIEGIPLEGFQRIPVLLGQLLGQPHSKITPPLVPPEESSLLDFSTRFGILEGGSKMKDLLKYFSSDYLSTVTKSSGYDDIPY